MLVETIAGAEIENLVAVEIAGGEAGLELALQIVIEGRVATPLSGAPGSAPCSIARRSTQPSTPSSVRTLNQSVRRLSSDTVPPRSTVWNTG